MNILALDPGTNKTGWVRYDGAQHKVLCCGVLPNDVVMKMLKEECRNDGYGFHLAIEMIASYGMAVGADVFETCVWIGRFMESWHTPKEVRRVFRNEVKLFLCNSTKAKDANVRQALLDLFPGTGGGAVPQVGTKKKPGPLFGVATHVWPALGVALATHDRLKQAPTPQRRRTQLV
jgi:hypothetical protein